MKKSLIYALSLAVLVTAFAACQKAGIPVAGSAKAEDMLTLIPQTAQGGFVIDVHRGMNIAFVDKAVKTGEDAAKYQEFITKVGIDPQKDVYFAAIGISEGFGAEGNSEPQGAGVINLKYDQAKVVAAIKEKSSAYQETAYEGVTMLTVPEEVTVPEEGAAPEEGTVPKEDKKPMYGAFLDASNIAVGTEPGVKAVIDVLKGKAESAMKNADLMKQIKGINKTSLVWSVFVFSPDQVKKMSEAMPMMSSLESIQALTMYVDDKNKGLQIEIKALMPDGAKAKEIADMLTGFKALGSMGAGEKPEVGELMNKIDISSGPDSVKIFVDLPEALMDKLAAEAEKQVKSKLEEMKPAVDKTEVFEAIK